MPMIRRFSPCFLAASTIVVACSSGTQRSGNRFDAPETIVVAPDSGISPMLSQGRITMPRYPAEARAQRIQAYPVFAYVIDAAGRVEHGSVSFLTSEPSEFRRAICEWAPEARFMPLILDGIPRRALVVQSLAFSVTEDLPPARRPPDPKPYLARFRDQGISASLQELEGKPRC